MVVVRARNTAAHLVGSIHDDGVARRLGYPGGIVSGVVLYTYVVEASASPLGQEWFDNGSMRMRFHKPVYDGDLLSIDCEAGPDGAGAAFTIRREGGEEVCAEFHASAGAPPPDLGEFPALPLPSTVEPTPEERFLRSEHLGAVRLVPTPADVRDFLAPLGVEDDRWAERGYVHPAYLFRTYAVAARENHMFDGTASIQMRSDLIHCGSAALGEPISVRGRIRSLYSERGHRYVDFDMLWLRERDLRPLLFDQHSAIYRRRDGAYPMTALAGREE